MEAKRREAAARKTGGSLGPRRDLAGSWGDLAELRDRTRSAPVHPGNHAAGGERRGKTSAPLAGGCQDRGTEASTAPSSF